MRNRNVSAVAISNENSCCLINNRRFPVKRVFARIEEDSTRKFGLLFQRKHCSRVTSIPVADSTLVWRGFSSAEARKAVVWKGADRGRKGERKRGGKNGDINHRNNMLCFKVKRNISRRPDRSSGPCLRENKLSTCFPLPVRRYSQISTTFAETRLVIASYRDLAKNSRYGVANEDP